MTHLTFLSMKLVKLAQAAITTLVVNVKLALTIALTVLLQPLALLLQMIAAAVLMLVKSLVLQEEQSVVSLFSLSLLSS